LGENSNPKGRPVTDEMVTVNKVAYSPDPGSTTEGGRLKVAVAE
jgi:hypothetical protein